MKKHILLFAVFAICFGNICVYSQQADPVSMLKAPTASETLTDEELFRKADALRQLTWTGNASALDAMVPCLHEEKLATLAQTALLNLPDGIGMAAMRQELPALTGQTLLGVIGALGQARDVKAVGIFAKLLKSDDVSVVKAVLAALGKIGDKAACDLLQEQLAATDRTVSQAAAVALLDAISTCDTLPGRAIIADKILDSSCSEFVKSGAAKVAFASKSLRLPTLIANCLRSENPVVFKRGVWLAVNRQKFFDDSTLVEAWKKLPEAKRMIVYDAFAMAARKASSLQLENPRTTGDFVVARPNPGTEQLLLDIKKTSPIRLSAIRCLGACCNDKDIVKTLVSGLSSNDTAEVQATVDALSAAFVEIDSELVSIVKQGLPRAQVAALTVMANRLPTAVGRQAAIESLSSREPSVRIAAYAAFALLCNAQKDDLAALFDRWNRQLPAKENEALADAIFLIAKRTPTPDLCCEFLQDRFAKSSDECKLFCFDILEQIGNSAALTTIVRCAQSGNDALLDKATQVLGQWINLDAAPFLLEIAKTCPIEKYRIRALRGYIRLVRQMGKNPAEQIAMADAAKPYATRKDEKELLRQLYARIEGQRKDKLLFDGRTFTGWEGDTKNVFRIENGCIVGGSLKRGTPVNEFLCTTRPYADFTLTCECKIVGSGGNAGIQFRSQRVPATREMSGYQADMTADGKYWGSLYDESRRKKFLVKASPELIAKICRPDQWNQYKIVCWGNRVKLYLNDVLTVDYTESDDVPRTGIIGLQIHGGPPSEAWYRNIRIEHYELVMTP